MLQLSRVRAARHVDALQPFPVVDPIHCGTYDFRHPAALDVAVVADAAPVLDAVETVRHRLDEVEVVARRERGAGGRETQRIEVDAGKVSPETVRGPVDGIAAKTGFDASELVHEPIGFLGSGLRR